MWDFLDTILLAIEVLPIIKIFHAVQRKITALHRDPRIPSILQDATVCAYFITADIVLLAVLAIWETRSKIVELHLFINMRLEKQNDPGGRPEWSPLYARYPLVGSRSIRVVHLQPGPRNAKLRCNIEVVRLSQKPSYEALSYFWGTKPSKENSITCQSVTSATEGIVPETDLAITATLHEALVCLRKQDKVRTLWVDQICINQNNDIDGEKEKSAQIKMMGEIYASSEHTHVWLRRGRPILPWYLLPQDCKLPDFFGQIGKSLEMLMRDSELQLIPGLGWRGCRNKKSLREMKEDYRAKYGLPRENDRRWGLLYGLFDAPWFSRVWIIQEVALPKSVQVHYADLCLEWDRFVGVMSFVESLQPAFMDSPVVRDWYVRLRALEERRQLTQRGEVESLDQLMSQHRKAEASMEHDHVFGLMGLASQESLPFEPDYSVELSQVFLKIAKQAVSRGCLDILGLCGDPSHPYAKDFEKLRGLPSWVPDFSDGNGPHSLTGMGMLLDDRFKALKEFNASKSRESHARAWPRVTHERFLEARGQFIGTIEEFAASPAAFKAIHVSHDLKTPAQLESAIPHRFEHISENMRFNNLRMVWDQWAKRISEGKSMDDVFLSTYLLGETGETLETARPYYEQEKIDIMVWRAVTFGHGCSSPLWGFLIFHTSMLGLKVLEPLLRLVGYTPFMLSSEYHERRRLSAERELFLSEDGRVGLAPRWAVRGDKICILQGGKVPVILRRTGEDGPYKFIGEAYVHGVMHGEIFDSDKCEQIIID